MTLNINSSVLTRLQGGTNQSGLRQSLTNITSNQLTSSQSGIKVSLPTDFNLRITEAFVSQGIPKVSELILTPNAHNLDPQKVEALL